MASKTDKLIQQLIDQQAAWINRMQDPASNPAQKYLTDEALSGAEWLKKGDYSAMPKGMFFDFKSPVEQNEQYKKLLNVNQGGTFSLGDNGGRGEAQNLQNKYLQDKFARDASQNYQDNISGAASNIRSALGATADAKTGLDARVFSAMQGLTGTVASLPQKTPWWQQVLKGAIGGASAFGF